MDAAEPYLIFTRKLQELGLRYMVSGSVAAIFYGEPRLTNDIDIILVLNREDVARLQATFPDSDFYCPPREVILSELARDQRGHLNIIHHQTGFKADVYLTSRDPLHAWGLSHAVEVNLGREIVRFAPPEYVMVRKLEFFREGGSVKHLRDIHRMLSTLGNDWSRSDLEKMIAAQRLQKEWSLAIGFPD